jgi:hypothetical protein
MAKAKKAKQADEQQQREHRAKKRRALKQRMATDEKFAYKYKQNLLSKSISRPTCLLGWVIDYFAVAGGKPKRGMVVKVRLRKFRPALHVIEFDDRTSAMINLNRKTYDSIGEDDKSSRNKFQLLFKRERCEKLHGPARKRAIKSGNNWRDRMFILDGYSKSLWYYKGMPTLADYMAPKGLKGEFDLSKRCLLKVFFDDCEDNPEDKPYCLAVTSTTTGMSLIMSFEKESNMREWQHALQTNIEYFGDGTATQVGEIELAAEPRKSQAGEFTVLEYDEDDEDDDEGEVEDDDEDDDGEEEEDDFDEESIHLPQCSPRPRRVGSPRRCATPATDSDGDFTDDDEEEGWTPRAIGSVRHSHLCTDIDSLRLQFDADSPVCSPRYGSPRYGSARYASPRSASSPRKSPRHRCATPVTESDGGYSDDEDEGWTPRSIGSVRHSHLCGNTEALRGQHVKAGVLGEMGLSRSGSPFSDDDARSADETRAEEAASEEEHSDTSVTCDKDADEQASIFQPLPSRIRPNERSFLDGDTALLTMKGQGLIGRTIQLDWAEDGGWMEGTVMGYKGGRDGGGDYDIRYTETGQVESEELRSCVWRLRLSVFT